MFDLLTIAATASTTAIALGLPAYLHHRKVVDRLTTCPVYQVGTRQKLEAHWPQLPHGDRSVIFFDFDCMHEANEALGYIEVDRRIASALAGFRKSRCDTFSYRWYSGDEILITVPTCEAQATATRLKAAIEAQGLSATIAIAPSSGNLLDTVRTASDRVQAAKAAGIRGCIV
jgi:GGDEF domain-containing protein